MIDLIFLKEKKPTEIEKSRSFGLDFVRALAITLVLIAHFIKELEHFGFWGVEMFFALSGFLIGNILWKSYFKSEEWSLNKIVNFWARRWWRTLPNYYLFVFVMLLYHYYKDSYLPSLKEFIPFIWFGQDFFSREGVFFGVSWSLCIEEWFYLLFPITLYLVSKIIKVKKQAFFLTLIIFFVFSFFSRYILLENNAGQSIRGTTLARLDSIATGVFVAFVLNVSNVNKRKKFFLFMLGLVVAIFCIHYVYFAGISYEKIKQNNLLLLFTPLGFALMLPFLRNYFDSLNIPFALLSMIRNMSLYSYSIYLSHIPIMFIIYDVLQPIRGNVAGNIISKLLGVVVTIFVSRLIYKYFEIPLTQKRPDEII